MTILTRAEVLTTNSKKTEFFSDFLDSFAKTPIGDQLGRVTNEKSVNQSIKNLIFTNLGERLFQPLIGSNVRNTLFELNDMATVETLEFFIVNCIKNNEKRANLLRVDVISNSEHNLEINILYNLINNPTPISLNLVLKRIR